MDLQTVVPGLAGGIGIAIAFWLIGRRNQKLAPRIEESLRARTEGLTLHELCAAIQMEGFYKRGKVVLAINDLVASRRVIVIPAPDGTPQLKKVDFIRYRLGDDVRC